MGKQIRFFMTEMDEIVFLETIIENKHVILDDKANILVWKDILTSKTLKLFIALPNPNILYLEGGFVNPITTEVVDFSRCKEWSAKILNVGRLWVEIKYYDNTQQSQTKSKQFNEMYNNYVKWIKKHFKISKCKDYYIGTDAYQKYKNEGYIMKAGPNQVVEFE